jgi:hypothetical protein
VHGNRLVVAGHDGLVHLRVGVEPGKKVEVVVPPAAKAQPLGS